MTPSERADAMGYGRRCCARCRWINDDLRCSNASADVGNGQRCLGDICPEWEDRHE